MRVDLAPTLNHSNRTYILYHKNYKNARGLRKKYLYFRNFREFFCKTGVGCRTIVIKFGLSLKIHSIFNILLFTNIKKYDTIL